jgi:hypothetical protein
MQTLTITNRVSIVSHETIETQLTIPAYFKDKVTPSVYAIAEDKRIVQVCNMRKFYHLTVYEPGDDQYEFKLKECSNSFLPTTEEHFFSQLEKLKHKIL